jgi:antitoxin MazE
MNRTIRSKIVKIGNSHGVRIPRAVLEQAGLKDEVEMRVEENRLIIQASRQPRQGWEEQFAVMAEQGDDAWIDETLPTQWDEDEWTW